MKLTLCLLINFVELFITVLFLYIYKTLYLYRTDLFQNANRTGKFGVSNKTILVCKARGLRFPTVMDVYCRINFL